MTRQEEKILKIIGEYYGDDCDIDDLFYENICTSDMEMLELIGTLEEENILVSTIPRPIEFDLIKDFIDWVVNNIEK